MSKPRVIAPRLAVPTVPRQGLPIATQPWRQYRDISHDDAHCESTMMRFIDMLFGDYAWYRKLRGGSWTFDPLDGLTVDLRKVDNLRRQIEWTEQQKLT